MITQHMLARPVERREAPRPAKEISLHSRELARRERPDRTPLAVPVGRAPRPPARAVTAWAWARALSA